MKITQDLHVHTDLSLCADKNTSLEGYVRQAERTGISLLGITNHYWDPAIPCTDRFYLPQNFEHICKLKPEMEAVRDSEVKVLFGAEGEYCYEKRGIAITEETASQLDLLLVPNSHTHLTMPKDFYANYQKHADYMLQAYHDILNDPCAKYVTAVPHPFSAVCCPYEAEQLLPYISDSQFRECFSESAAKKVAVEINSSCFCKMTPSQMRNSEYLRMFEIARDSGCKFTFGSDAHSYRSALYLESALQVANLLNLRDDQILVLGQLRRPAKFPINR